MLILITVWITIITGKIYGFLLVYQIAAVVRDTVRIPVKMVAISVISISSEK